MVVLKPGQTSSKADHTPAALFGYQPAAAVAGGFFVGLDALSYRVLDADGVEVVPLTEADVVDDALALGLYAPSITVPEDAESFGTWTVEWTFVVEDGDSPLTATTTFRVVSPAHPVVDGYAQVQDLYDEGAPEALFAPARVARALALASRLFEEFTGRRFGHRFLQLDLDGRGGPLKQLELPIIGLTSVAFAFTTFSPADLPIEAGDLRVYNRHIRSGLLQPDDRDDPRVEFLRVEVSRYPRQTVMGDADLLSSAVGFPLSQQNLRFEGLFGYTDPDGSPFGAVPGPVVEAVLRIALTKLQPLWVTTGGGGLGGVSGPISSEKTLDQAVTYADATSSGSGAYIGYFTGDPTIDQVISMYRRPPRLGSTG